MFWLVLLRTFFCFCIEIGYFDSKYLYQIKDNLCFKIFETSKWNTIYDTIYAHCFKSHDLLYYCRVLTYFCLYYYSKLFFHLLINTPILILLYFSCIEFYVGSLIRYGGPKALRLYAIVVSIHWYSEEPKLSPVSTPTISAYPILFSFLLAPTDDWYFMI